MVEDIDIRTRLGEFNPPWFCIFDNSRLIGYAQWKSILFAVCLRYVGTNYIRFLKSRTFEKPQNRVSPIPDCDNYYFIVLFKYLSMCGPKKPLRFWLFAQGQFLLSPISDCYSKKFLFWIREEFFHRSHQWLEIYEPLEPLSQWREEWPYATKVPGGYP
jgi:hypothetical protein